MIACADRLRYRRMAFGEQSGEQQRGLDLRAGDWDQILDTVQPGAGDAQRGAAAFGRLNLRAHPGQGLNDSAHGPARERLVSDQLRGERSEEHTSELQSLRHLVCRLLLEKK